MIKSSRSLALLTVLFALSLFNPTGTPAQEPGASFQLQTDQYGLFRLAPGITSGELTFPLDRSNVVNIEIITTSDALTTSILAPGGQVIDPNNAEALGGSYTLIPGFRQQDSPLILPSATPGFHHIYTFPWRGAGDYTVRFQAPANLSAETPVIVQVSTDSTIGVRLLAGESEVAVGRPVALTAAVFDGETAVAGASVAVLLKPPTGVPLNLTLRDDGSGADAAAGDGLYSGEYTPTAPGGYGALARITGTTGGISYRRESATNFTAVPSKGRLTGVLHDAGVDENGDGLYDRVAVSVQAEALVSGAYRAFVRLKTAGGQTLVRSGEANLSAGTSNIGVNFEAPALIQLGEDGPYAVEHAQLIFLGPEGPQPVDARFGLGQTQAYRLSQVQRPALIFTGRGTATGVDVNGNGKYDTLKVQAEVLVMHPGFYEWSGTLDDASDREIDFIGNGGFLSAGSNLITLTFDGRDVGRHAVNGPYFLQNVILFNDTQSAFSAKLLATPAFSYREFEDSGDALQLGTVTAAGGGLNGAVIPGGSGTLKAQLVNVSGAALTGLNAALTTTTPGVTITRGASGYPSVAASGRVENGSPFEFSVAPTLACGQEINFKLAVRYDQDGGAASVVNFVVTLGQAGGTTVSYAGPPVAIPDSNSTGISIPLVVNGAPAQIGDLNFSFDGSSCTTATRATTVGLDHTWVGDLVVTLTSPQGTTVTLMRNPGNGAFGVNFCHTVFDDEAGVKSIQNIAPDESPYSRVYTPTTPLAAFRGENPNGTWMLHVRDTAGGDTGSVRAFSLAVGGAASCQGGSDSTPPATSAQLSTPPNAAGWHKDDVVVTLEAVDNPGGSGVRDLTFSAAGAQTVPETTIAGAAASLTVSAEGTTTVTFRARDNEGNAEPPQTLTLKIDKTAPKVIVVSPAGGLLLNQQATADYACGDTGSGVSSCVGSIPNGGTLEASSVGLKPFSVTASDAAGNTVTRQLDYAVSYGVRLKYDDSKAHRSGSTIPIRIQLVDANGVNVSSQNLTVHALGTAKSSDFAPGEVEDSGNANPDDNFRFTNFDGQGGYIFNLKTMGLATGTYVLVFSAGADPLTHGVLFQIK